MGYLNDRHHPLLITEIVGGIDPVKDVPIACAILDFRDEGLVTIQTVETGKLVALTPHGKHVLNTIYSGRMPCD